MSGKYNIVLLKEKRSRGAHEKGRKVLPLRPVRAHVVDAAMTPQSHLTDPETPG